MINGNGLSRCAVRQPSLCCAQGIIQETALIEWPSLKDVRSPCISDLAAELPRGPVLVGRCLFLISVGRRDDRTICVCDHRSWVLAGSFEHPTGPGAGWRDVRVPVRGQFGLVGVVDCGLPVVGLLQLQDSFAARPALRAGGRDGQASAAVSNGEASVLL